jgi:hypothetical protein
MQARTFPLVAIVLASISCGETPGDNGSSAIDAIVPPRGPLAGGNEITIRGSDINRGPLSVTIGGVAAPNVAILDDGNLLVTVPPGREDGPADVLVASSDGVATVADGYSYNPLPTVAAVVPDRGSVVGASVSVMGTGFEELDAGDTEVLVDGEACADVSVQSDSLLVCNVPPGPAWTLVDVEVSNANGSARAEDAFGYMQGGLFVVEGRGGIAGTLYFVDTEDGSFTAVSELTTAITGISPALDGTLYGVTSNSTATTAGFPRQLVTIDPFTGATESLGPLQTADGSAVRIPDIAMDMANNTLYGWSKEGSQLVTIDLGSGEVTPVGGDQSINGGGLAFDLDGALFLAPSGSDGEIFAVTPGSGALAEPVDASDPNGDDLNSMAFESGTLYGIREGVSQDGTTRATLLLDINLDTGAVTNVHDMPFGVDALSQTPPLPFM